MKLFKKLASFMLAFTMVMAIAMPSVVMAADTTYKLTLLVIGPLLFIDCYNSK